jgi:hypothetical protein
LQTGWRRRCRRTASRKEARRGETRPQADEAFRHVPVVSIANEKNQTPDTTRAAGATLPLCGGLLLRRSATH